MEMEDLHSKYRPKTWDEVVGHKEAVESLRNVIKRKKCRAFVFTGPSGVGKTTFARIIANSVGCEKHNLVEIDAATHTGIDAMREITERTQFTGLGKSGVRVVCIDEAHALSRAAWQSLLKSVEEPPEGVYWIFCTTEAIKIPDTIRTRCAVYDLGPIGDDALYKLLRSVAKAEKLATPDKILSYIADNSDGSPRKALTCLAKCEGVTSRKIVAKLLRQSTEEGTAEIIELCRALYKGATWPQLMEILKKVQVDNPNPESVRNVVLAYFTKVTLDAKQDRALQLGLTVLEAFGTPYAQTTGFSAVMVSLGQVIFR